MYPTQRVIVLIAVILSVASALPTGVALSQPQASLETAAAKPGSLEGAWLGTLQVPATKLRIVFNITTRPDGSLSATLDSPDQGATGIPVSAVGVEASRVTLEVSAVSGRYEGTLNEDGSAISGQVDPGRRFARPGAPTGRRGAQAGAAAGAQEALSVHRRRSDLRECQGRRHVGREH